MHSGKFKKPTLSHTLSVTIFFYCFALVVTRIVCLPRKGTYPRYGSVSWYVQQALTCLNDHYLLQACSHSTYYMPSVYCVAVYLLYLSWKTHVGCNTSKHKHSNEKYFRITHMLSTVVCYAVFFKLKLSFNVTFTPTCHNAYIMVRCSYTDSVHRN